MQVVHVILISKILCFVFHFFIVNSTDSSLNLSWLKRPAQGLYFLLSTDVVNTMLVSISLVCSSAQQETQKNKFFSYIPIWCNLIRFYDFALTSAKSHIALLTFEPFFIYIFYSYFIFFLFGIQSRYRNRVWRIKLLYFASRYVTSFTETQVLWRGQHGQGKLPALFIRLHAGTHQNSLQATLVLQEVKRRKQLELLCIRSEIYTLCNTRNTPPPLLDVTIQQNRLGAREHLRSKMFHSLTHAATGRS